MIKEQVIAPVISINFDELEAQAKEIAKTYTSIAITEESYKTAKADAKMLAGFVNDIEKKRRALKSQAEAPIKEFDQRCKAIEQILTDAKLEIEGVTVKYDDKKKEERDKKCRSHAEKEIKKAGLRPEFAERIVEPSTMKNLTTTQKVINADYDAQIAALKLLQDNTDMLDAILKSTVDAENLKIKQQLKCEDFAKYVDELLSSGMDPKDMAGKLGTRIHERAAEIAEAEEKIRQEAIDEEKKRQAQAMEAAAAKEASEMASAINETENNTVEARNQDNVAQMPISNPTVSNPFQTNPFASQNEPRYEGVISLSGAGSELKFVLSTLKALCKEHNVNYEVTSTSQVA